MSDNYGSKCPCCKTEWKITTFGRKVWKDCLKCEDTAENIFKKVAESPKEGTSDKYKGADWLQDWADEYHNGHFPSITNYSGAKYNSNPVNKDADDVDPDDWGDIPFLQERSTPPPYGRSVLEDILFDIMKRDK